MTLRAMLAYAVLALALAGAGRIASAGTPVVLHLDSLNTWDHQYVGAPGGLVAHLPGSGAVHFAWTNHYLIDDGLDELDPIVRYRAFNTQTESFSGNGTLLGFDSEEPCGYPYYPRYSSIAVDDSNRAHVVFFESCPTIGRYAYVASQTVAGGNAFSESLLPLEGVPGETGSDYNKSYPRIAADAMAAGDPILHVAAYGESGEPDEPLFYWRYDGTSWSNPVVIDSPATTRFVVASDPASEKVTIVLPTHSSLDPLRQVMYFESVDNGISWVLGGETGAAFRQFVTNYADPMGPQAWDEVAARYDSEGNLHVVWVEQRFANATVQSSLRHWDAGSSTIHLVTLGYWGPVPNPSPSTTTLARPSLAIGNGWATCPDGPGDQSNQDYLYVVYTQFGGRTQEELDDQAANGRWNGDICMVISDNGGDGWSQVRKLTDTHSPGCGGTLYDSCASEDFASISPIVDDTLHIAYTLDFHPPHLVWFGINGGSYSSYSPQMYMRVPGGAGDAMICPTFAPALFADLSTGPVGEYASAAGAVLAESLIVTNSGSAAAIGSIDVVYTDPSTPSANWLGIQGSQSVPLNLPPLTIEMALPVTMDATAISYGVYKAEIRIAHNDTLIPSPLILPVEFLVRDHLLVRTGGLWLGVNNMGGVGNFSSVGGLNRLDSDSSFSVRDASLIIARPPSPDTAVWREVYGDGAGQHGFLPVAPFYEVDTAAYGTGAGRAMASASMITEDSAIGVDITYVLPQHPDSSNFILAIYRLANGTPAPIDNVLVGMAADLDVVPGPGVLRPVQPESQNTGQLATNWNLIYQQGVDTTGHVIVGDNTATRFKAGVSNVGHDVSPRAWSAPSAKWLVSGPVGGFGDGYLYREMTATGFELFPAYQPDPNEDLHSVIVFDNDLDLDSGGVKYYLAALVSSNEGPSDPTDLIASTKQAWKAGFGWRGEFAEGQLFLTPLATNLDIPYHATGSHEDGLSGGCVGCVVTELSDECDKFELITAGCEGMIRVDGSEEGCFSAVFRLRTPCGGYTDDAVITVSVGNGCWANCDCPFQGDINGDGFIDATDLAGEIDIVFFGESDPRDPMCPGTRGDFNADGVSDAVDLALMIDHVFFGGIGPGDPCVCG